LRVLALTRYPRRGSSSRLRVLQYEPALRAAGIDLRFAPLWPDAHLEDLYRGKTSPLGRTARRYAARLVQLLAAPRFDVVWLEAEAFPYLPALAERALARLGVPIVVDYDDAVFHKYDRHRSLLVRLALGRKVDAAMRASRVVVAGNEYLAQRARAAGARDVEVVPTVVDVTRYEPAPTRERETPVVCWIGTSLTAEYLRVAERPLADLVSAGLVEVRLMGAGQPALAFPYRSVPWSEDEEVAFIRDADIGIMPLPDSPWERGKCGYKLIQYMACGLPVVASPVGVNVDLVGEGERGWLASGREEWREALTRLVQDAAERQRLGARGRAHVEAAYDVAVTAPRLAAILRRAAGRGGA
jgi:glycosyltransferase involved in cell wall biosynthesis